MNWTLPPNRKWFRLEAVTPTDVPWRTRISIRIRTWIWLRRVEGIIRRELEREPPCPHGDNWDDCPDCRH